MIHHSPVSIYELSGRFAVLLCIEHEENAQGNHRKGPEPCERNLPASRKLRQSLKNFFCRESSRLSTTVAIVYEADRAFSAAQGGSTLGDTNEHFLTAVQGDLLTSVERRGSQATSAADHGTDTGAFAAAENPAQ